MKKNFIKLGTAVILGYKGTNFKGMQNLSDATLKTVEQSIEKTFFEAGLISETNYRGEDRIAKVKLTRASRTDKGVHAAMNVINLKMMFTAKDMVDENINFEDYQDKSEVRQFIDKEKVVRKMNEFADPDVRYFGRG